MIGLSVLLAVIAYLGLARFVARRVENRAAKYAVIAVFVLIPTWDIIPGKLYFNSLCENQAGLKTYKTVEGVEGYRVLPGATGLFREGLDKYGYKFEERGEGINFRRYALDDDGKMIEKKVTESIAKYAAEGAGWRPLSWNVKKYEVFIFDQQTTERLAVWTTFSAGGNWLQALFNPYLGGHGPCADGTPEKELYLRTLKSTESTN